MPEPDRDEARPVPIPNFARVHLAHAVIQRIATEVDADLLHIKGAAMLPGVRPAGRESSDVDVLVRPGDFDRLERGLSRHGWEPVSHLATGSAFQHAANWWHPHWGYADLHAHWPGATISAGDAYAVLGEARFDQRIAHVPCPVPGEIAQLLLLLLHAARAPGSTDVEWAWTRQPPERRQAVTALAQRLGAEVAMAAAIGGLDAYRDDPQYPLWRFYSQGGGRLDDWRARLHATTSWSGRGRILVRAIRVDRDHLHHRLGRPPTRADIRQAQLFRLRRLLREVRRVLLSGRRGAT